MYPHLFEPIKIRNMEIRNRVVFPAMATRLGSLDGKVTEGLIAYYEARAKGGCGLIIVEATSIHTPTAPEGFLRICEDEYIEGLSRLTEAVHMHGAKISVQLWQGGFCSYASDPRCPAIVPDEMTYGTAKFEPASKETLHEAEEAFGKAAARAVKAGFDTVEFHCGHQYSPAHFLSGAFNHRTDEYGGSLENRARYALESIAKIRENVPEDFPVGMRIISLDDFVQNGNTIEDTIQFVKWAKEAGIDFINVSRGNKMSAAFAYEVPSIDIPNGFNVDNAAKIKAGASITTIAVGRINDPAFAEGVIADGKADMVVMGRAQICDPEFCNKASSGHPEDIVKCIGCNQGCLEKVQAGKIEDRESDTEVKIVSENGGFHHVSCLRNPFAGYESQKKIIPAENPKTIAVIGGGMGGMEAAWILKQRGHNPVLIEESDHLGGQFIAAGQAPRKAEMAAAASSRGEQLIRLGADVRLNTAFSPEVLDEIKPDAVICAIGASPIKLKVPGIENENVFDSMDILYGRKTLSGKCAVIGGGLVGVEVAEYLAEFSGCDVTVIEMQDAIAKDIGSGRKIEVMMCIAKCGIKSVVNATCKAIESDGVIVDVGGEDQKVEADNIVVAVGSRSNDSAPIKDYCESKGIRCYLVGDAKRARRAIDAVHEAADAALTI